jgi:hypothetical protein
VVLDAQARSPTAPCFGKSVRMANHCPSAFSHRRIQLNSLEAQIDFAKPSIFYCNLDESTITGVSPAS